MGEEKKGHVRISVDIEVNEALMELMKEGMASMPKIMAEFRKRGRAQD
ncbi:MAG: hypothetical protein NWF14_05490 [Candidatus Bathyarchaeota archaeon]|nr:hypothetical protein [Candidatus Bathyarchaeota archaeon]